jgi:hypothetical protein
MKTLVLSFVFLASSAIGQPNCTTLIYTGAPFTSLVTAGSNAQPLVPLAGTITLSAALPPNAANLAVSPTAWQFYTESPNLNSQYVYELSITYPVGAPMPVFYFTTDAKGNITKWNFIVQWFTTSTPEMNMSATSSASGDTIDFNLSQPSPVPPQTQTSSITGTSTSPGVWTCDPPPAPTVAEFEAQIASLESQLQWQTYYAAYWKDAWVNVELQLEALKK